MNSSSCGESKYWSCGRIGQFSKAEWPTCRDRQKQKNMVNWWPVMWQRRVLLRQKLSKLAQSAEDRKYSWTNLIPAIWWCRGTKISWWHWKTKRTKVCNMRGESSCVSSFSKRSSQKLPLWLPWKVRKMAPNHQKWKRAIKSCWLNGLQRLTNSRQIRFNWHDC